MSSGGTALWFPLAKLALPVVGNGFREISQRARVGVLVDLDMPWSMARSTAASDQRQNVRQSRGARVAGRERPSPHEYLMALKSNNFWPNAPFTQKMRGAAKRACPSLTLIVMRPWRFGRFKPHQTPYQS
jgi:hypothetical protein